MLHGQRTNRGAVSSHPIGLAETRPKTSLSLKGLGTTSLGYERLRASLADIDYDAIVLLSPHWQTYVARIFLAFRI